LTRYEINILNVNDYEVVFCLFGHPETLTVYGDKFVLVISDVTNVIFVPSPSFATCLATKIGSKGYPDYVVIEYVKLQTHIESFI